MQTREWKTDVVWVWRHLDGLKLHILCNCLIGMLRIAISLSFVWICKAVVDVATGVQEGNIWWHLGLMLTIILLQVGLSVWNTRVREKSRFMVANRLRSELFERVIRSQWHGKELLHSADTVNRLKEDIRTVSSTVTEQIPLLFLSFVQLIAASFILFSMQRNLLWVLLIIMPVALIVSKVYFKILRRLSEEIRQQDSELQKHMQESLLKRMLILSMGREEESVQQMNEKQQTLYDTNMRRVTYSNWSHVFIHLGFMGGYITTFAWSVLGIMHGTVTYGMMTACLQLVNQVQHPIMDMSGYLPKLITSLTAVDRLREMDDLKAEEQGAPEMMEGPLGIRVKDVTFTYEGNADATIKQLNYDFRPGVSTAIVGKTGSGKSTLMRILLGLLRPEEGNVILYNGTKEKEMSAPLRCNLRYVPQGNSLMSGTIRDNLLLGDTEATDEQMRNALRLAAADFVFEREEGLDLRCSEQGSGLSEGQAQRIAIARALLQKGAILLMDEACSSVDEATEQRILENLRREVKDKTIIWVTHHARVKEYMSECLNME